MRNADKKAYLLSSARNLALAEQAGLSMMILCKCCYGSLKKAAQMMKQSGRVQDEVRKALNNEGLTCNGNMRVSHFLSVLYDDIGLIRLKEAVSRPYKDLKIAAHYGCHALRPSDITGFDDPIAPTLFENLVNATGADSVDWATRLECCGSPAMGINDDLSLSLTQRKLNDARKSGAEYLCTSCSYCQIQFDNVQQTMTANISGKPVPAILYSQLLGLSMGIDERSLGIEMNLLDISGVKGYLG
jgi:heterodisulfide reductase subunit B